jgi:hypothetical protein
VRNIGKVLLTAAGVPVLGGLVFIALHDPEEWNLPLFCPFHSVTGLLCPGCGSLRSLHDLMNLRVGEAFRHNAFSTALVAIMPVILVIGGRKGPSPASGMILAALMGAFWVLRNI